MKVFIEKIEASISSGGGKKMVSPEKLMKTSMSKGPSDSGTVFEKNSDDTVTLTPENISIMEGVTSVYIDNIKNVSGIEYFTNLSSVNCDRASEQEILDLTTLKNLTFLYFACDKLVSLTSLNLCGIQPGANIRKTQILSPMYLEKKLLPACGFGPQAGMRHLPYAILSM